MTGQLVATPVGISVREWARTHVEHVDEHLWGPPPALLARLARELVELVRRAHHQGLALRGFGPDAVRITDRGEVRAVVRAVPGSAAERADDLPGLGTALFHLATGTDPGPGSAELAAGNPGATELIPIVAALTHPDPGERPGADAVLMLLTGQRPATGTLGVRLTA